MRLESLHCDTYLSFSSAFTPDLPLISRREAAIIGEEENQITGKGVELQKLMLENPND